MGWLSTLADVGLGIAAPFTGGLSLDGIPLANKAIASMQGNGANSEPPADVPDKVDGSSGNSFDPGSIISSLMSPNGQYSLGKGLGGVAQADASNRGTKIATTLAANNEQMAEQAQRNADLNTLPGQIIRANYIAQGGYTPKANYSSNGRLIPHFDLGLAPLTAADKAAGSALSTQLTNRLNNAPTYKDPTQYMNPSATENALNWISPVLTASGAAQQTDPTAALIKAIMNPQGASTTPAAPVIPQAKPISVPPLPQAPNVTGLGLPDSDNGGG